MLYPRNLAAPLLEALSDTPVVLVNGPRQSGKSTLIRELIPSGEQPSRYLTLDDAAVLAAARTSPADFLAGLEGRVAIDEVQRAPELLLAAKAEVDRDRRPGRFLFTGSADVLTLPRVAESLAGRMEVLTLWPLSQGERERLRERFVDLLFSDGPLPEPGGPATEADELWERVIAGGYPEAMQRERPARRRAWFASYVTTILQRDVRDISNVDRLADLPRLLSLAASRSSSLLNFADLARDSGIPQTTLKRYLALLEATFLVQTLPAWAANLGKRLTKSPKLTVGDSGLMAYLTGLDAEPRSAAAGGLHGSLLETFVTGELRKQVSWSEVRPRTYHFRDYAGQEVDILLEDAAGRLVGIEVKASRSVGGADFRHLRALQEARGERFRRGVVLYTGAQALPFGPRLHALPIDSLWRLGAEPHPA